MSRTTRRLTCLTLPLAAVAMLAPATPQAFAAGAQRLFLPETYDAYEHFAAGDGPCVGWAGTFHEVRSGGYSLVQAPGGQVDGEVHVNGSIEGLVELIPDEAGLPTYTGSYREKTNAVFTGTDADGEDMARIAQYRLRAPLTGTNGTAMTLVLSGKVTFDANGRMTASRDTFSCS